MDLCFIVDLQKALESIGIDPENYLGSILRLVKCENNINATYFKDEGRTLKMVLYANGKPYKFKMDSAKMKNSAVYDKSKGMAVFVHGFHTKPTEEGRILALMRALDGEKTHNALLMDASGFLDLALTEYEKARDQVDYLGQRLAEFLIIMDVDFAQTYLIGHSLGAHIAGIAGQVYRARKGSRIGRITGLDPANPCFQNVPDFRMLTEDDAAFVDIIHTNNDQFGLPRPSGTADFYPNGGSGQPGCAFGTCDHWRAVEYFTASFDPDLFLAARCDPSERGVCRPDATVATMGYHLQRNASGIYVLVTGPEKPFGLGRSGLEIRPKINLTAILVS